jgi:hypothetical protein
MGMVLRQNWKKKWPLGCMGQISLMHQLPIFFLSSPDISLG